MNEHFFQIVFSPVAPGFVQVELVDLQMRVRFVEVGTRLVQQENPMAFALHLTFHGAHGAFDHPRPEVHEAAPVQVIPGHGVAVLQRHEQVDMAAMDPP